MLDPEILVLVHCMFALLGIVRGSTLPHFWMAARSGRKARASQWSLNLKTATSLCQSPQKTMKSSRNAGPEVVAASKQPTQR